MAGFMPLAVGLYVYVAGAVAGLALGDGPLGTRVGVALAWPLGPLAFVLTIALLLGAATIAFPVFGTLVVAAALALWASW